MVSKIVWQNNIYNINLHNIELNPEFSKIVENSLISLLTNIENSKDTNSRLIQALKMLKFLSNVDLVMKKLKKSDFAFYSHKDSKIYINSDLLKYNSHISREVFQSILQDFFLHEITHCYQDKKNNYIKRFNRRYTKFRRKITPFIIFGSDNFRRRSLFYFIENLFLEGLATYVQHLDIPFSLNLSHGKAKNYLKTLKFEFLVPDNYGNFDFEKDYEMKYWIGYYMTNVILLDSSNGLSFDDLVTMNFKQFIEVYEKSIDKLGKEVLISYSSGKGILDYLTLINEWKKFKREKKKNKKKFFK